MDKNTETNLNTIQTNDDHVDNLNDLNSKINETKNENKIFKKKYIILLFTSLFIFITAIFIYLFVSGINFNVITRLFHQHTNSKLLPLWLTILIISPLISTVCKSLTLFIKVRKLNVKIHIWEWIELFFVQTSITIITPFAIGGEPYGYYWLRRHKISHEKAITSIGANYLIYQICSVIFGSVCLIYVLSNYYPYFVSGTNGIDKTTGTICIWFSIVGTLINIAVIVISFFSFKSIKFHVGFSKMWNWFLKKIGFKYKTTNQIIEYYELNSSLKKAYLDELKKTKENILIFLINMILIFFSAILPFFSLNTLAYNDTHPNLFNFFDLMTFVSVSWTANSFIPIPGGEGTMQWILATSLTIKLNDIVIDSDLKNFINDGVFIWRFYTSYLIVVIGLIMFVYIVSRHKYLSKALKNLKIKPFINILIPCYNAEKYLPSMMNNVLKQIYENYEIILCDDGSTDNTRNICQKFEKENKNVKLIINEKNIGLGKTRQKLINACEKGYFIFFDVDDYVTSSSLYSYVKKMDKNYDVIFSKYRYCFTNPYRFLRFSIKPPITKWKYIKSQLNYVENTIGFFWNLLIDVKFYKSLNISIDQQLFEDAWIIYMFTKIRTFLFVKKYTYRYWVATYRSKVKNNYSLSCIKYNIDLEINKFNQLIKSYGYIFDKIISENSYQDDKNKYDKILWFQLTLIILKYVCLYRYYKKNYSKLAEFIESKLIPYLKKYNYKIDKYKRHEIWYSWLKKHKLFKLIKQNIN